MFLTDMPVYEIYQKKQTQQHVVSAHVYVYQSPRGGAPKTYNQKSGVVALGEYAHPPAY
jgi:hypothetical protein